MSEREVLTCPFCGAPYTEAIPRDVVNVKCKYCKSIILLPSNLSVVPRCPNHTDTIAIGLCNECMQAFCKKCLYFERRGEDTILLCPTCLESRRNDEAYRLIAIGVIIFFVSLLALTSSVFWFIIFLIFSLPFIVWGLYIFLGMEHAPHLVTPFTLQQWEEDIEERRRLGIVSADVELLYWKLWREYVMALGVSGPTLLERRIHSYVNEGLTLDEAIKKLAKFEMI